METKFGIEIPHFEDYIPEVDDKYLISPTDPTGIGFALSGKEFGSKAPYTEKIRYIENLISTELDKLGHEAKKNFKGYDHYDVWVARWYCLCHNANSCNRSNYCWWCRNTYTNTSSTL
jgi:hypothetical protein